MSASSFSTQKLEFQARNNARAALTAFLAIVRRDLLVTRREALTLAVQMLAQPLFFLFVFGKVLPTIGVAIPGFSTLLLTGLVSPSLFATTFPCPSVHSTSDAAFP